MTLKDFLKQKKMTQKEAARQIDVNRSYLNQIICGKRLAGRILANRIECWSGGKITIKDLWRTEISKVKYDDIYEKATDKQKASRAAKAKVSD